MKNELIFIRDCIEKYSGIAISDDNLYIIENRVPEVMRSNKINSFEELCKIIDGKSQSELLDKIINIVTINETFWFRDKAIYVILEQILLPRYIKLLSSGEIEKVSIWSSACSSGQEPYSIAMFIDQYLIKNKIGNIDLNMFEIIASDICDVVLAKCDEGIYDSIAMERGIDNDFLDSYFTKKNKIWLLDENIRKAVKFQKLNLKNHNMKREYFDIILCRYVLIYFSENNRKEILKGILASMKPDGVLFVGSSEIIDVDYFNLSPNDYEGGRYHTLRK